MNHTLTILLAAATLTVLVGCGSVTKASKAPAAASSVAPTGASGAAVQLGGDPCAC